MSRAHVRPLTRLGLAAALLAVSAPALAAIRREGEWPKADKTVTLDLSRVPRSEALRKLADAAGWGLLAQGLDEGAVDLHIKNQPADRVLELLLAEGNFVARRDGSMLSIRADGAASTPPAPPAPPDAPNSPPSPNSPNSPPSPPSPNSPNAAPVPPVPPVPTVRGEDRVVRGGSVRVEPNEVVHDITVYGGSVHVWGTVTGNVGVFGGSLNIHPKAHVYGSATVFGGSVRVEDDARIDGDVGVMGGSLRRSDKAIVGGKVNTTAGNDDVFGNDDDDDDDDDDDKPNVNVHVDINDDGSKIGPASKPSKSSKSSKEHESRSLASRAYAQVSDAVQGATVLFLFGSIVIALAGARLEKLQEAIAAKPMKTLALGFVGALAFSLLLLALAVSVVGIPFAIVAALLAPLGGAAGACAALTTLGRGLSGHRTTNPYVHLGVGCALLAVAVSIPFAEDFVKVALIFMGFGSFVVTRAAGFVPPSKRNGPYRTSSPNSIV